MRDRTHLYISIVIFMIALVIIYCSLAWGATVKLVWDHEGAEGYRLYLAEFGKPLEQIWQGSEKTKSLELANGVEYWCAVTAYQGNQESAQSDILQFTAEPTQQIIVIKKRPTALRIEFSE